MTDFKVIKETVLQNLDIVKPESKDGPYGQLLEVIKRVAVTAAIAVLEEYEKQNPSRHQ